MFANDAVNVGAARHFAWPVWVGAFGTFAAHATRRVAVTVTHTAGCMRRAEKTPKLAPATIMAFLTAARLTAMSITAAIRACNAAPVITACKAGAAGAIWGHGIVTIRFKTVIMKRIVQMFIE